jgi:hypothetical protein
MKTKFTILLLALSLALVACTGVAASPTATPQPTLVPTGMPTPTPYPSQKLRLVNQSTYALENLVVRFPQAEVAFGTLAPGQTSDYREVPLGVYRYAAYRVDVAGQHYEQPVIDWVGEVPIPGAAFTYILDADPAKWGTEGMVVILKEAVTEQ